MFLLLLFSSSLFRRMKEHQISIKEANSNLLACAAYLAESIKSADGQAEAMKEIVPRYLAKGEVDIAAGLADTVDDPFTRDRLLTFVAEKCAAINDDEYAFQLVESIEEYATQQQARERIALQKSAQGDLEKAFEIAEALEHPDEVFADVALKEASVGDEDDALETIDEIEFAYAKTVALQNIALLNLHKGKTDKTIEYLEKAKAAAADIEFTEEQIRAFLDIGNHFIEAEHNGKAIETFDTAKTIAESLDNIHRDSFLAGIALGFLRAGSIDLADRTLDLVTDKTQMSSALIGFSQVYSAKDETAEALETLEEAYQIMKSQKDLEIRDSGVRFRLWRDIAILFARLTYAERAIEIAQEIPTETEKMAALSSIAQTLTLQKKDDLARLAFESISDDLNRVFALLGVSDAKKSLDEPEEALSFLNDAYAHAETLHKLAPRSTALIEIARRFLDFGDQDKARELASENIASINEIRDESSRAVALAALADFYEQAEFELNDAEKEVLETMNRTAQ